MNIIQLILTTTLAEACNLNFTDKETKFSGEMIGPNSQSQSQDQIQIKGLLSKCFPELSLSKPSHGLCLEDTGSVGLQRVRGTCGKPTC